MANFILFSIISVFFLISPLSLHAKEFVVGIENINYYPLYDGSGQSFRGFGKQLLDDFAKDKGYTFVYKPLPVSRLFETFLNSDELDFKFPDNEVWSADAKKGKHVVYSAPTVQYVDGVSVKPDMKNMKIEDLKVLGIIRGFTAWEFIDRIQNKSMSIEEISDYDGMLKKAILGRTDGAYSNIVVLNQRLKDMGSPDALVFADGLPHTKSAYHLSSIKHPEVISEFNAWMSENQDKITRMKKELGVELTQ